MYVRVKTKRAETVTMLLLSKKEPQSTKDRKKSAMKMHVIVVATFLKKKAQSTKPLDIKKIQKC